MSIIIHPLEVSKPWYNKYENNSDISSGGSGSGSDSGDERVIYYKFKQNFYYNQEEFDKYFLFMLQHAKIYEYIDGNNLDDFIIASPMYFNNNQSNGTYVFGFAFKPIISKYEELTINSVEEYYQKNNIDNFDDYLERCTAEEFYNNNWTHKFRIFITKDVYTGDNPPVGEHSRAVKEYEIEPWMTIDDWLNSKYNIDGLRRKTGTEDMGSGVYVYAPYALNGEKAFYLMGHSYNPIKLGFPLLLFFQPYMCETDNGEILTHLYIDSARQTD